MAQEVGEVRRLTREELVAATPVEHHPGAEGSRGAGKSLLELGEDVAERLGPRLRRLLDRPKDWELAGVDPVGRTSALAEDVEDDVVFPPGVALGVGDGRTLHSLAHPRPGERVHRRRIAPPAEGDNQVAVGWEALAHRGVHECPELDLGDVKGNGGRFVTEEVRGDERAGAGDLGSRSAWAEGGADDPAGGNELHSLKGGFGQRLISSGGRLGDPGEVE